MSMLYLEDMLSSTESTVVPTLEAWQPTLDGSPSNEEIPTEVGEDGVVREQPQQAPVPPKGPIMIQSKCPLVITSVMIDGQQYTRVDAAIRGSITDMDGYVNLIDMLNRATDHYLFYLHIESGGGMVTTGATIASAIADCKGKVTTIAEGLCASAASLIWSAGHVCEVGDYAMFMYHMSSHADMNNSLYIAESAQQMVHYVQRCLMRNALKHGHITPEEHVKFCENKEEVWIPAATMRARIAAHREVA